MENQKVIKNWKIDVEHRNGAIIFRSYVNGGTGWWKKFSFMIYDDFIPFVLEQLSTHLTQRAPDAVDSAASTSISEASALSTSQTDQTPQQRG